MRSRTTEKTISGMERIVSYRGYEIMPEVAMVPEGELFGGTWIVSHCCLGRACPYGYEVRYLLSDNDHFATRRSAIRASQLRAVRTIDLGEEGSMHLSPFPATSPQPRQR